jgi:hypothetical protein
LHPVTRSDRGDISNKASCNNLCVLQAVKGALEYLTTNFPNMTVKELGEMGIIDSLLQYHVTAGNAALTSDRLKNGMKLTMLDGSPITLIKK